MIRKNILNVAIVIVLSMLDSTIALLGSFSEWKHLNANSTDLQFFQGLKSSVQDVSG